MIPHTPWYIIARRAIPFALLQVLLRVCYFLVLIGYGKASALEFRDLTL